MSDIKQILNFMVEVEKLKSVLRKTKPVGHFRYENSAEHSWHVSLMALLLKDHADDEININRVIKMLLIHDLGEIEAGDTIIYASETTEIKQQESQGIHKLFALLPAKMEVELNSLWLEFEAGETNDAKFAKAIDRVPPLLHNIHGEGHSWKRHNISKEKVFSLNKARIQGASHTLWEEVETELNKAVEAGALS
ncbi:phosphohydrolase [Marinomonas sp. SBI22]|uniref:HD domain-containing protein n=1 Tax=unclassified Marinomonas TaxID=196814 RepID=UPI0007AF4D32|nr:MULTISPECIES: HD domain-containing protein [unclassified Marinomonas]KZM41577.1 phosphohydrolase [Marinomonas sp. SBI22]KZM43413.1 phosphohydrolase [Marinomonas sp. SBI8L]